MTDTNSPKKITTINKALSTIGKESLCAKNLKYTKVYDSKLRQPREVSEIIGTNIDNALKLRNEIRESTEENARYRCPSCNIPLSLLSTAEKSGFYFKHKHSNNKCPIKDGDIIPPDVLRALKFKGRQESDTHFKMKTFLYTILNRDVRFSDIKLETVVQESSKLWKKPDVSGKFQGEKIVFEIQLATELLDVIISRRKFYIRNNTLLVWIFQKFSFDKARISELDTLYTNNNNVLVLDEDAARQCLETNKLHLTCYWREPSLNNNEILYKYNKNLFDFATFTKDVSTSQIFHYDFNILNKKTKDTLFTTLWDSKVALWDNTTTSNIIKSCYGSDFEHHGYLPALNCNRLSRLIHAIWTARKKESSGWKVPPISIFNNFYQYVKPLMLIFIVACKTYGLHITGKNTDIEKKKQVVFESLSISTPSNPSPYLPKLEYLQIIEIVFPTLYAAYQKQASALGIADVENDM